MVNGPRASGRQALQLFVPCGRRGLEAAASSPAEGFFDWQEALAVDDTSYGGPTRPESSQYPAPFTCGLGGSGRPRYAGARDSRS